MTQEQGVHVTLTLGLVNEKYSQTLPTKLFQFSSQEAMRDEATRVQSFDALTLKTNVFPKHLAKAGFYYIGPGDRVHCAFCYMNLHNWNVGNDPHLVH